MKKSAIIAVCLAVGVAGLSHASIVATADGSYDTGGAVYTLDPEANTPASRGLTGVRQLRQTFQLHSTIDVGQIVVSLANNAAGGNLGVRVWEVSNVNSSPWSTNGTALVDFQVAIPTSTARTQIDLSGADVFTLVQRDTGTEGYAIELYSVDGATQLGSIRHSNSGTDNFTEGAFIIESGAISRADRDIGLSITAVIPEPATIALFGIAGLGLMASRRRFRR